MNDAVPRLTGVHVVVIEDHPRMLQLVTSYLEEKGASTTGRADGDTGLDAIIDTDPDVVVLDLMLPGLSGTGVCRALRAAGNDVPVIMLTARGEVAERVAGLEAGADDYLVKPFALEELYARIQAISRRREDAATAIRAFGDLTIDPEAHRVWVGPAELTLPRREFDVLTVLMSPPGAIVSKQRLHEELWDEAEADLRSNSLEVYISRLRHHLGGSTAVTITTIRRVGYRLDLPQSDEA
jgi:DNA-binding response OmpR family regulator